MSQQNVLTSASTKVLTKSLDEKSRQKVSTKRLDKTSRQNVLTSAFTKVSTKSLDKKS
jgi:hypothetical protein